MNSEKSIITAIAYVRVSTDEQAEGFSLDAQIDRIKAYAKSQDYCLIDIYSDDGYSAKDTERPALKKLLSDVSSGQFKIVLSYRLDRLTRRVKDLNDLIEYFEKNDVKFESVTEPFETKTAAGRLMLNVFGGFAQFEREVNSERTIMGLQKRFSEGKWMTAPPFGYSAINGNIEPDEKESSLVKKIFDIYLSEGFGTKDLAKHLNEKGFRNRRNNLWRGGAIHRILTHKAYIGKTIWKGKEMQGIHKPIISDNVFFSVQEKLRKRNQSPPRSINSKNIFSGLISCGKCNSSMYIQRPGSKKKAGFRYYVCGNVAEHHSCKLPYINANLLEGSVLHKIMEISRKPDLINTAVSKFNKNQAEKRIFLERQMKSIRNKIAVFQNKKARLMEWLDKNINHSPSPISSPTRGEERAKGQYSKIMENINAELEMLDNRLKVLREDLIIAQAKIQNIPKDSYSAEIISGYLGKFDFMFQSFDTSKRKMLVESVVKNITAVSKDEIRLKLSLPLMPLSVLPMTVQGGASLGVVFRPDFKPAITVDFKISLNKFKNKIPLRMITTNLLHSQTCLHNTIHNCKKKL